MLIELALIANVALGAERLGIIESGVLWPTHEVRVCWLTEAAQISSREDDMRFTQELFEPISKDEKERVRKLVTSAYSVETTGVEFTGWQDCGEKGVLGSSDAVIIMNTGDMKESVWGQSDVALGYEDASLNKNGGIEKQYFSRLDAETIKNTKRMIQFALQRIPATQSVLKDMLEKHPRSEEAKRLLDEQLRSFKDETILHEFGHLAGLRHEHCRDDRDMDSHAAWQFDLHAEDQMSSADTYGTPYDPLSIMNYNHTGVAKSLYAVKYFCERGTMGWAKLRYKLRLENSDCKRLDEAFKYLSGLTAYDRYVLKRAYGQKTEKPLDEDKDTREYINKIVQAVKRSKLAPKQIVDPRFK